jgi:hypothetical protein
MKFLLSFVLLSFFWVAATAAEPETLSMVGVLMDANCPTIAGGSRHADSPGTASASRENRQRHTAAREGTRARRVTAKPDNEGDRYEACKATASTTVFAIHTDGQLFLLDEEGNDVVRQQMRNDSFRSSMSDESGAPRWLTVMVEGRRSGERLSISSLRR